MHLDGELKNAQIESVSGVSPTPAVRGRVVIDTASGPTPLVHDGTVWRTLLTSNATLQSVTADPTITFLDQVIDCDASGGAFAVTLPAGSGNIVGQILTIRRLDQTLANLVTVTRAGADTIDGVTTVTLATQGETLTLMNAGATWKILHHHIPKQWTSYTPTGLWVTNATFLGFWRRVGDCVELSVEITLGGAPTSANLTIDLPTGIVIDTAKMAGTPAAGEMLAGSASFTETGVDTNQGFICYSTTSAIVLYADDGDGSMSVATQANPFTFGSTDKVRVCSVQLPVVGWDAWAA
jgi:hypothetical protein